MSRRPLALTIAAAAVFAGSVAFAGSSGAAVDQDLVVSAASGTPGTVVEVSSASCIDDEATSTYRLLQARMISGTAPGEVMAGAGYAIGGQSAQLVVPDWVDPDADAVIEATCFELVETRDGVDETEIAYTPVPFDVEPGVGAPVQARTLSRTALQAGQAFQDSVTGCTLPGATFVASELFEGGDLTGRALGAFVAGSEGDIVDGSLDVVLSNGTYSAAFSQGDDGKVQIDGVSETPTDIPAGTYASYGYCGDDNGALLFFEPTTVQVTGNAPFGSVDLTQPDPYTRSVVMEGQACTVGTVEAVVFETSLEELQASGTDDSGLQVDGPSAALASGPDRAAVRADGPAVATAGAGARSNAQLSDPAVGSVGGGERVTLASGVLTPEADGTWAGRADLDFDQGLVEGFAACGDPLAAGFYYDPQIVVVDVSPAPPPTTDTTVVVVQPAVNPTPASAVSGSPTYAG